ERDAISVRGEARTDAVPDLREQADLTLELVFGRGRSARLERLRHRPILHQPLLARAPWTPPLAVLWALAAPPETVGDVKTEMVESVPPASPAEACGS